MTNQIKPFVVQIQTALGFPAQDIDGILGPHTYDAIRDYQRAAGADIATVANLERWHNATIASDKTANADSVARQLLKSKGRYEVITVGTGVPWWFIAALHMRESSCAWDTYLGNGEPLTRVTRLKPYGRGPFSSWEAGAIDALKLKNFHKETDWSIGLALDRAEIYNGHGYKKRGLPSPYLWSWSNQYVKGKYVRDGEYDKDFVDRQIGVAVIWKCLEKLGKSLT